MPSPPVADLTDRRLRALLAVEQRHGRVPSVAAALTRDGATVWRSSAGAATGAGDVAPTDLQYRIGSITKTMTAVVLLQLRDEGRLALADRVADHVPEVAYGDRTLRALLCHDAGLPAEPPGEWWERVAGGTFAALAAGLDPDGAPFGPGATHHYSNLGFGLLGEVAARVSGRPWWDQVATRILAPLGMDRTTYAAQAPHARGYSVAPWSPLLTEEPAADTGAMAPAGQVWSTVGDLAAYAGLLAGLRPDVLAASTLEEMATPQAGTAAAGLASGYGVGLRLLPGGSGLLVGHTGSMPGFQASLFVDRGRRTGAAVLANGTAGLRTEQVAPALLATLEECEPTVPEPWAPVAEVPAAVAELLGVWHWGNTPRLLTWDGAVLRSAHALTGTRVETWRLVGDRLVGASGYHHGEPVEVVRRADGTVSHLVLSTFVLTREPYDPASPVPGGHP